MPCAGARIKARPHTVYECLSCSCLWTHTETWAHRFGVIPAPHPPPAQPHQLQQHQRHHQQQGISPRNGPALKLTEPMAASSEAHGHRGGPAATGIPPASGL